MCIWGYEGIWMYILSVWVAVSAFAFCQRFCVVERTVFCHVQCLFLNWFFCLNIPPCMFCVCIGRYCRSSCSCCISCKEHEPPGNAQKHQHWWHQHKSAKFTVLQIVATRSQTCRCPPVITVMQYVYQNFKLLLLKIHHLKGTVWFDTIWFAVSLLSFLKKKPQTNMFYVCFSSQSTKSQYLFITETFLLPWWRSALDI